MKPSPHLSQLGVKYPQSHRRLTFSARRARCGAAKVLASEGADLEDDDNGRPKCLTEDSEEEELNDEEIRGDQPEDAEVDNCTRTSTGLGCTIIALAISQHTSQVD